MALDLESVQGEQDLSSTVRSAGGVEPTDELTTSPIPVKLSVHCENPASAHSIKEHNNSPSGCRLHDALSLSLTEGAGKTLFVVSIEKVIEPRLSTELVYPL